MAIGKNAIKRVENNGYSKVKTAAPDMENSHVIANISEEVMEKMVKPVEEKTAKKVATKKTTAKKAASKKATEQKAVAPVKEEIAVAAVKKPVAKKAPVKKAVKEKKPAVEKVELGKDMPYYLL